MIRMRGQILGLVLWLIVLGTGLAVSVADVWDPGDDTVLGTDNELVHGSVQIHELGPGGASGRDEDFFSIGQRPLASYEIVVDGTTSDIADPVGGGMIVERYSGTTLVQGSVATFAGIDRSRSLRWETGANSNIASGAIRVSSLNPCVGCSSSRAAYHIRAYETTYSIPRFNNSASQVTVLQVTNAGGEVVTGSVHFWAANSTLLGSLPFSLTSKQTLVQNTSSLPFAAGTSGSITVASNARYGDLNGKAVAVEPGTGFTFDTAMVPRPR